MKSEGGNTAMDQHVGNNINFVVGKNQGVFALGGKFNGPVVDHGVE